MARQVFRRWWAVTVLAVAISFAVTACVRFGATLTAGTAGTPAAGHSRPLAAAPHASRAAHPTPSGPASPPSATGGSAASGRARPTAQPVPVPAATAAGSTPSAVSGASPGQAQRPAQPASVGQATWLITRWALRRLVANPALRSKLAHGDVYQVVQPGVPAMPGVGAPPIVHFTSVAGLRDAISRHRLPAGTQTVLYDPEAWRFTPIAEQRNPVQATRQAAALAHAHGLKLLVSPGLDLMIRGKHSSAPNWQRFLNRRLAASLAGAADGIELQAQSLEQDPAAYTAFVRAAAGQARQAKPGITVLAGLSTNPSGVAVTSGRLASLARAARPAVSGYWLNIPGRNAYCPACRGTKVSVGASMLLQVL